MNQITSFLLEGHKAEGNWILAPKADITTPKFGRMCYGPAFWLLTENDEVLFYKAYYSPQCHIDIRVLEKLGSTHIPFKTKIELIEMAYIPHRCSDYF